MGDTDTVDFLAIASVFPVENVEFYEFLGTPGRDNLVGTEERDRIIGQQGADRLTGGEGEDIFVYQSIRDAGDIITDFEIDQDTIDLTEVLKSVGYTDSDPLTDGYIEVLSSGDNSIVYLDSDGSGSRRSRPYITVEQITPEELTGNINHFSPSPENENQPPTDLDLTPTSISENIEPNSVIGTLTTDDPDLEDTHTYTLTDGEGDIDNDVFEIVEDKLRIKTSPDFEDKSSYSIRVQTTDEGGLSFEKVIEVEINNVNEAPTDINLDEEDISEDTPTPVLVGNFSTIDPDEGDSHTYRLVEGDGSDDNNVFTIIDGQLQLNESPDFEEKLSYNIRVQTIDEEGLSFEKSLTIDVTNVNEPPIIDADKTLTVREDSDATLIEIGTPNDTDGDELTITIEEIPRSDAGTVQLREGTEIVLGQVLTTEELTNLVFLPVENATGEAGNFRYRVDDGNGGIETQTIAFRITPVNDAPILTVPTSQTTSENTDLLISGINVEDIDAADAELQVSLSVSNGVLSLEEITGLTFSNGDGIEDEDLVFTGSLAEINTALNSLRYRSNTNFEGTDSLSIAVSDFGNTGDGGAFTDTASVAIAVSLSNVPPTVEADKTLTVDEDSGASPLEITTPTDGDGDKLTITIEEIPDSEAGKIQLTDGTEIVIGQVLTIEELTNLVFLPVENATGEAGTFSYTVDDGNGGTATQTITLEITPVNDAPILTVPTSLTTLENTTLTINGFSVDDIDVAAGELEVSLSVNHGVLSLEETTGLSFSNGDGIENENLVFTGSLAEIQAALNSLTYRSDADFEGTDTLNITVNDLGNTGDGGAFTDTASVAIAVSLSNVPPTVEADKTLSVNEDSGASSLDITAPTDADEDNLTITVTSIPEETQGRILQANDTEIEVGTTLSVSDLQALQFVPQANANGNAGVFSYIVDDSQGGTATQTITLEITPVNDAPILTVPTSQTTSENTDILISGINIEDIDATDAELQVFLSVSNGVLSLEETTGLTFSNGDGIEDEDLVFTGSLAEINTALNSLTYRSDTDFEGTDTLNITVNDLGNTGNGGALTDTASVAIEVTVNPVPIDITAILANDTGDSDSDRITTDPTISGQTVGTTVLQGNLNGQGFVDISNALNEDGSLTISLEQYEILSNGSLPDGDYTLELKAGNDSGVESESVIVSFSLDRTAPLIDFDLAPASDTGELGDGVTTERIVSLVGQTDPELEVILRETGQIVTADSEGNFNFTDVSMPIAGVTSFNLLTTDIAGNIGQLQKQLTRIGINGAPTIISTPETIFDTTEEDTYTYQIEAIDPDDDPLTYTLLNGLQGAEIDPEGLLSFTPAGNLRSSYEFNIEVLDGRGGTDTQTFVVEFPNVIENSSPEFTSTPIVDGDIGTEYSYQPTAIDPDGDSLTFSLIEGPTGLTIETETGFLLWTPEANQGGNASVTIQVSDEAGLTDTQSFTIDVQEPSTNNAPIFISEPVIDFAVAVPNTATGDIDPELISLNLADGETATESISITLPGGGISTGGQADIVFVVDESGSMNTEHEWLTNVVVDLEAALQERGITDNRYSLIGYTNQTRLFNLAAQTQVAVYSPDNQLVKIANFGEVIDSDSLTFDLLADGTYTIVVNPLETTNLPFEYNLNLAVSDAPNVELTNFNTPFNGTVAPQAEEIFNFDAPAGTQIFFDGLNSTALNDIRARLVDANGNNIFSNTRLSDDNGPYLLSESGNYSLIVNGGNAGGDFSFQLLELSSDATEINLDTEVTGTIATGLETEVFQFNATGGQQLYFDSLANQSITAAIYGPDNRLLGNGNSLQDFTAFVPNDGTYTLVLRSTSADAVDYDFKIVTPETQQTTLATGEIVSATLNEAGEEDIYLIEGTAGQRIWFDGLEADSNSIVSHLISPTGQRVLNNTRLNSDSGPITLPDSGTYSLVVNGGDQIGSYSFQLLDIEADATKISSEVMSQTAIVATFEDGLQTKLYEFEGSTGQKLFFDTISSSSSSTTRWQLYAPDNTRLTDTSIINDFTATLATDGTYTLLIDGNNSSPFDFTFKVAEQVIEEETITLGETVASSLTNPGEQDIYRFSANSGDRIWFDGLSSDSFNIDVRLTSPTGEILINQLDANNDSIITLPENGTYSAIVNANNTTGDYSFRILNFNDADPLTFGVNIDSTLNPGTETKLYSFQGSAGQELFFDLVTTDNQFRSSWRLYGPISNRSIAGNNRLDDFSAGLPIDGTYTLVVDGNDSNDSTNYRFNVSDLSTSTTIKPSGFDTIYTGSLTTPDQEDIFTFEATAGTRIVFDGLSSDSFNIRALVTTPNGNSFFSSALNNDVNELILPESGTYSIAVTTFGSLGDYSFRVLNLDDAIALPLDTVFNGSVDPSSGIALYEFTGAAGEEIFIDGISTTGSGFWQLYSSENSQLGQFGLNQNFRITLPADDTYALLLDGNSTNTFEFSVQVVTPETQESTLTINETISGTLTEPGEQDIYRFSAEAGQRLIFDGLASDTNRASTRIVSPTGVQLLTNLRTNADSNPFILPESGEYSLILDAGDQTDNYRFRLLDIDSTATTINLDSIVNGTVASALATELYQFTGNAGQKLFFNGLTNSSSLAWRLLSPSNINFGNQSFTQDFSATLPTDGIYTLVLDSNNANPVDFSFEIVTPEDSITSLSYGEVASGTLSESGETDIYQFAGVAGQKIWFDGSDSTTTEIKVALVSPSGDRLFERLDVNQNSTTPLTLFESGTYSLILNSGIRNPGEATGDYSFQVWEVTSNLTVPGNITGTFELSNQSQVFQFEGNSGQQLSITPDDSIFGTANQISDATAFLSITQGGTEDGYLGIDSALQLPFRDGAATNIILVTDEDRDIVNPDFTFESILNGLANQDALLNVTINGSFLDGNGNLALGVDSDGVAYIPDGNGGFITSPGGAFGQLGNNPDAIDPIDSIQADYVDLAWDSQGAGWDLNQLREGGDTAASFTQAFINVKAEEIGEQLAIDLLVNDPEVTVENLTGSIFGAKPGETASFDVEITGDGLARSFEIFFVRPETGFVLGSIPVSLNQNYLYLAQAVDPDGDSLTYSLVNAPSGATIDATTGRIDWTPPTIGSYQFEVAVTDDRGVQTIQSYEVEVVATGGENTAPTITSVAPDTGRVGSSLSYQVVATDADDDPLSFFLADAPEGVAISSNTGLLSWTPTEDQTGEQTIIVQVVDSRGGSDTQSFVLTVNENQKPSITSNPVRIGDPNQLYEYDVNASDPERTALTYSLRAGAPNGMTIDSETGLIQWTPTTEQTGQFPINVFVNDGEGGRSLQSFLLTIGTSDNGGGTGGGTDNETPVVSLGYPSNVVEIGEDLTLQIQGVDNEEITRLELLVDGSPVSLTPGDIANGVINEATVQFSQAGLIDLVATVEDNDGNTDTEALTIRVIDPNDTTTPTIDLDLSQFEESSSTLITTPTEIIGTINDPNLEFYRLEIAPINSINLNNPAETDSDYRILAEGSTSISNDVIGQIDPTLLANGNYFVRVITGDFSGNVNAQGLVVTVASDFKPGRFTQEFVDLSIPLAGLPIEVNRVYDSLESNQIGDFGFGWSLGVQDARIQESVPVTDQGGLSLFTSTPFQVGSTVTLTNPEGERVTFTFDPVITNNSLLGPIWSPRFVPEPGVFDTLEVDDIGLSVRSDNTVGLFLFGLPYNPSEYRLTTRDGTTYQYDQFDGLESITDLNGNTLTYTDDGIFSSTGESVEFRRDAEGRITEILDPAGESIEYDYDANGDLVSVTDRTGNTSEFLYELPQLPHYLTEIIDPLGRSSIRNEYDEQDRLIRIIDADGNALELDFDGAASSQTISDPLGNETTFIFDDRGNIVQEVDAEGGITQSTFDDDDNLTSTTDPRGNTTTFTYDGRGNVLTETDALGNTTTFTYNNLNQVLTTTDARGNVTTNRYDERGNLLETENALENVTRYTYDANGNLKTVTDADNNVTRYDYDTLGRTVQLEDAVGAITRFTYDRPGNLTTITTPLGNTTTFNYDAEGRLIKVIDAEGNETEVQYNAGGQKSAVIDALGRQISFEYDNRELLEKTIYPDGTSEVFSYDANGQRISTTDRAGRVTRFVYDNLGRLEQTIYPDSTPNDDTDNPSIRREYDEAGNLTAFVDENGNRTEFEYDAVNRQLVTRYALDFETKFEYDAVGNLISLVDALNRDTKFSYDELNRFEQTTFADGTSTQTIYDELGRIVKEIDQNQIETTFEYDGLDRLTAIEDALGNQTIYTYDGDGNLISQQDALGRVTSYDYDQVGQRIETQLPLGQTETFTYDPLGNLKTITNFNGETVTYIYNNNDLIQEEQFADGSTVAYTYTPTLQLKTVTDERGTTTYDYDERERLTRQTNPDDSFLSYTYDPVGNRTSLTTLSGTVNYAYDPLNRIKTVTDRDNGQTEYTYDPIGNLLETILPNGVVEARTYNEVDNLTSIEQSNSAGIFARYDYTLDNTGRRVKVEELDGRVVDYDYDDLYRLTQENITDQNNGNRTVSYTYDDFGNRLTRSDSVEGSSVYVYNENDRLLSVTTDGVVTTYTYDDNGNLITETTNGETITYSWNQENQLIAIDAPNLEIEYQYDAEGNLITATVNGEEIRYLVDAEEQFAQVVEEYAPDGTVQKANTFGNDLIFQEQDNGITYQHGDALGSVQTLTDESGNVVRQSNYDAFGRVINQEGIPDNDYGFTGEQQDQDTGLTYLRARHYDNETGRFISQDPFEGFLEDPLSLNRYSYAHNDPVNLTDPSGNAVAIEYRILIQTVAPVIALRALQFGLRLALQELLAGLNALPMTPGPSDAAGDAEDAADPSEGAAAGAGAGTGGSPGRDPNDGDDEDDNGDDDNNGDDDGDVTDFEDITIPGSKVPNKSTNLTRSQFEQNLLDNGFTKSTSKDGQVNIFDKGNTRFTTRDFSRSTDGPTAERFDNGQLTTKIRLGR